MKNLKQGSKSARLPKTRKSALPKSSEKDICVKRGFHDWKEFIDPKSGGWQKCLYCGKSVDCEEDEGAD